MKLVILVLTLVGASAMAVEPMKFKVGTSRSSAPRGNATATLAPAKTDATSTAQITPAPSAGNLSLANFQPAKGVISATIAPEYGTTTSTGTSSMAKYTGKTIATQIRVQYGMSPTAALKLETSIGQNDQNFTGNRESHNKGLSDIVFGYSSKMTKENGQVLLGADLSLSLEAASINLAKGKDGNRFSGGQTITPYIGFEMARTNAQVMGMVGSLSINQDKRADLIAADNTKSEMTVSGGNTIAVKGFSEWTSGSILAGLSGQVSLIAGKAFVTASNARIDFDSQTMFTASVYGKALNDQQTVQWIPSITFTTNLNKNSGNTLAGYDDLGLAVAARF